MSCADIYTPQLRERGYRMTPQRLAILHVLHHSGKHLTPSEVYAKAQKQVSGLTEATVYRTLEFLAKHHIVRPAHMGNGHLVYEIARHEHHHHLKCRVCGDELEVQHKVLEKVYNKLEVESGYQLTDSHITFFGVCPDCQTSEDV